MPINFQGLAGVHKPVDTGKSLADIYKDAEAIKSQRRKGFVEETSIRDDQTLRELYRLHTDEQGNVDIQSVQAELARRGSGTVIPGFTEKSATTSKSVMETGELNMELIGRAASTLDPNDPSSIGTFKKAFLNAGGDRKTADSIPNEASPEEIIKLKEQLENQALSVYQKKALDSSRTRMSPSLRTELYKKRSLGLETGIPEFDNIPHKVASDYLLAGKTTNITTTSPTGEKAVTVQPTRELVGKTTGLGKDYSDDLKGLANAWEKSTIGRAIPAVKTIDTYMTRYPDNLPGVGYLKNTPKARYLLSSEGKAMLDAKQWLFNADLKLMSGGAVTDSEAERQKISNALDMAHSAEDYRRVYRTLIKPLYVLTMKGMMGAYSPATRKLYLENKGPDLDGLLQRMETGRWDTQKPSVQNQSRKEKDIADYRAAVSVQPHRTAEFRKKMIDAGYKESEF